MAIRFVLPEQESESVAFAYSPVVEAVLSLHVLVAPRHHPLQHAWVRRMRKLDPKLKAEIRAFSFAYVGRFPDFLFPRPDEEFLEFDEELAFCTTSSPRRSPLSSSGRSTTTRAPGRATARPSSARTCDAMCAIAAPG